ncbi:MAG: hypothetical protein IJM57_01960 [Lachnospiraceae bacterium]|nr:hypothetical protein [Lachnospiraceae bacterium]
MGLFDDLKDKKYPNNGDSRGKMKRVYAGPGQMGGFTGPDEDDPEMVEVYAGPGMMDELDYTENPEATDEEQTSADSEETPDETENEADAADKQPKRRRPTEEELIAVRSMQAVYAGPDYWSSNRQNHTPIMLVYAGPAQMANGAGFISMQQQMQKQQQMQAQQQTTEQDTKPEDRLYCPSCGCVIQPEFWFCPECGRSLKKKEGQENV